MWWFNKAKPRLQPFPEQQKPLIDQAFETTLRTREKMLARRSRLEQEIADANEELRQTEVVLAGTLLMLTTIEDGMGGRPGETPVAGIGVDSEFEREISSILAPLSAPQTEAP